MNNSKLQTEGILALEAPFIRVPLEQLKKSFKLSQKIIEKDLNSLVNSIVENSETSKENVKSKLNSLKRKLTESKNEEDIYVNKTAKRLAELSKLSGISAVDSEEYERWSRLRLNRILVDYLLRKSFNNSGEKLAQDAGIQDLVDLELFRNSAHLQNCIRGHSVSEALLWCKENSSSLKKNKSSLEFNLRFQEYIELARNRKLKEAIGYAKKYLTAWSDSHLKEIQQGMALLAFSPETSVGIYKMLYDDSRWEKLVEEFKKNNYEIFNLTLESLLVMTLQVGLSALKTPDCYQEVNRNINCPTCSKDTFGVLAEKLPNSHHLTSCLVCRISGDLMNENNVPLALPNGYVYSSKALNQMAGKNGGTIVCPRTGDVFTISQCKKLYIS